MKLQKKPLAIGCMAALAGILSTPNAFATGTCYAFTSPEPTIESVDGGPPIVLRYIPTSVGPLTTDTEAYRFGHLRQTAFSLVGKATALFDLSCAELTEANGACPVSSEYYQIRLMTTIDGTIIVGRPISGVYSPDAPGAHMGINMHLLRYVPGFGEVRVGPVDLECTTSQTSATPNQWLCSVRAEFDVPVVDSIFWQFATTQPIVLQKVNSGETPACSVFQDGRPEVVL
jgi:hypothetical protein